LAELAELSAIRLAHFNMLLDFQGFILQSEIMNGERFNIHDDEWLLDSHP
jgi:hypothetical protein